MMGRICGFGGDDGSDASDSVVLSDMLLGDGGG